MKLLGLKKILSQFMAPPRLAEEEDEPKKVEPKKLLEVNVFPLKDAILFPGGMLPLHIIEDRYKAMADDALKRQIPMAMSHIEGAQGLRPGQVCGGGKVTVIEEYPDHHKNIMVEGETRFRIKEILQEFPFVKVLAEKVEDVPFEDAETEQSARQKLETNVKRWVFTNPSVEDALLDYIFIFDRPQQLADFIGNHFLPTVSQKQKLLEEPNCAKRVDLVNAFLEDEVKNFTKVLEGNSNFYVSVPRSEMH